MVDRPFTIEEAKLPDISVDFLLTVKYNMQYRYAPYKSRSVKGQIRRRTPEYWKSGPDPLKHEMYYAWAKHRSQAQYRKEQYDLTWEDWQVIWADPNDFLRRGRKPEDLTLTRKDPEDAWSLDNVEVMLRLDHLRREMERRKKSA